jgi:hypothetical protein
MILSRQLHSHIHSLAAGAEKEGLGQAKGLAQLGELVGQLFSARGRISHGVDVCDLSELLYDGFFDLFVAVANNCDSGAATSINDASAIGESEMDARTRDNLVRALD